MSLTSALEHDIRSQQIVSAALIDALQAVDRHGDLPCPAVVTQVLSILPHAGLRDIIRKNHPDLLRLCIDFILRPRTHEQRHALVAANPPTCRCDRSTDIIQQLHILPPDLTITRTMDTHRPPQTPFERVFRALLYAIHLAYYDARRTGITKVLRHATDRIQRHKTPFWPSSHADIAPYGVATCFESLCSWIPFYPYPRLVVMINDIFCLLPGEANVRTLVCTIIPDAVAPVLYRLEQDWYAHTDKLRVSQDFLEDLYTLSRILGPVCGMDEKYLATSVQRRDYDWPRLLNILVMASQVLVEASNLSTGDSNLHERSFQIMRGFAASAARIHSVLRLPRYRYFMKAFEKEMEVYTAHQHNAGALANWYWYLYGGHLCAAPECQRTYVSEGRRLRPCAGCRHVFYCSPACQRSAWRHHVLPHKDICAALRFCGKQVDTRFAEMEQNEELLRDVCAECLAGHEELVERIIGHLRLLYTPA